MLNGQYIIKIKIDNISIIYKPIYYKFDKWNTFVYNCM